MRVYIKDKNLTTGVEKDLGSFTINQDDFIAYLMTPTGKKTLKQILPPDLQKKKPSDILKFLSTFYIMLSNPPKGLERDFYLYDFAVKGKTNYCKIYLENYFADQVTITKL